MSRCVALQTHLSSVVEAFVHAAIAEMGKLMKEETLSFLRSDIARNHCENDEVESRMKMEREEKMKQFASIMEVLGNEALGKIHQISVGSGVQNIFRQESKAARQHLEYSVCWRA
ncbi:hypothetical protein cypCar_00006101 [Cyprinus carpio]|nr:hypothetical protein cypCar_00006101 [Cyprinus carpio]